MEFSNLLKILLNLSTKAISWVTDVDSLLTVFRNIQALSISVHGQQTYKIYSVCQVTDYSNLLLMIAISKLAIHHSKYLHYFSRL